MSRDSIPPLVSRPLQITAEALPLAETVWEVCCLGTDPIVSTPPMTLDFTATTVSGSTGCNGFSGPLTQDGATLRLGPLAAGRRVCTREAYDLERRFLDLLARVEQAEIVDDGATLVLRDGAGIALITAVRP